MKDLAANFLTESEKKKIIDAVNKIEKITSGEVVPMVVSSSYHYPVANILGSFIISMIISMAAVFIFKNQYLWLFLSVFMVSFVVFHEVIKSVPVLKRLFISDKEINEEVEEAAITSFCNKGLSNTRDRTGVLIFISVFERKVWVLADSGINKKVTEDTWQNIVDIIINGIKNGQQGDSIVKAISMVGEILMSHFPVREGDEDELSNLIIED
ncbi:MAG: TPM domain-containing protein [Spirochaetes bacterium]|nr:TPM domain-containing protein [Spirochaetota bacterium]